MDVSVIMINYNTFDLTKDALNSIFENTKDLKYEIILLDNNSPDGSGEKLNKMFGSRITYIQTGSNLGTSKAFNEGVSRATGKYVLWLNTDILLRENFIKTLFDYMESHPKCGICGGNVLDFDGNPTHSFRKKFPCLREERKNKSIIVAVYRKLFRKPFYDQYNYTNVPMRVGYITGADMMIRSSLFEKVGKFDAYIFMYSVEVEFTWRAVARTGMTVMAIPNAHIFHLEGASFRTSADSFNEVRFTNGVKGSLLMYMKCYGETAAKKYLTILKRSYLKFGVVSALLFMRQKRKMYVKKRAIVKDLFHCFFGQSD